MTDLGPRVEAELAKLSPRQRANYEPQMRARADEDASRRLLMAELQDRHPPARRFVKWSAAAYDTAETWFIIAAVCVGVSALGATCVGVVLAIIRAGWRAGASL